MRILGGCVVVLLSACASKDVQCIAPQLPAPPPAVCTERHACGVMTTADGDVDCGGCPRELVCGALAPNVCGGITCSTPPGEETVLHLTMTWNGTEYRSPTIAGALQFVSRHADSEPLLQVVVANSGTSQSGSISLDGDVVTANVSLSGSAFGARCQGSARSSTVD